MIRNECYIRCLGERKVIKRWKTGRPLPPNPYPVLRNIWTAPHPFSIQYYLRQQ